MCLTLKTNSLLRPVFVDTESGLFAKLEMLKASQPASQPDSQTASQPASQPARQPDSQTGDHHHYITLCCLYNQSNEGM